MRGEIPSKKQQIKSLQTKNDLKASAATLFAERGYTATSVQDIVQLSGYSIGAFYGHFQSKQELATTLWMDIMTGDILDTIQTALKMTERDQFIDYLVNQAKQIRDNSLL
ncbi:MAG: TetR/AcrR family transcriptional regulator, partial [Lachnospiraceae bacterium]|nr:TetR/AcrR family transcriptional regulator [Lachnospiraceae bacterium]